MLGPVRKTVLVAARAGGTGEAGPEPGSCQSGTWSLGPEAHPAKRQVTASNNGNRWNGFKRYRNRSAGQSSTVLLESALADKTTATMEVGWQFFGARAGLNTLLFC